jgi:hypothetical protein
MILHQYDDQEPCQGMNCGTTTAQHSKECIAEHTAACASGFFGKWISVDDRLPLDEPSLIASGNLYDDLVVIATDGVTVHPIEFRAGRTKEFWSSFDRIHFKPTHWMPLPPPPSLNE